MSNKTKGNITDIDQARQRKGAEGASRASDVQMVTRKETGLKSPKNGLKTQITGRPKGAKDKVPRKKRIDINANAQIPADEKQAIVAYNAQLFRLGKMLNPNDLEEVLERIEAYFKLSEHYAQVPTVAAFALALGIDRRTLWAWLEQKNGTIKNPEVLDVLKRVYNMIAAQYEGLLTQGKIVPVAGFFMMQNNFGYKNQTDHVVTAVTDQEPDTNELAARAGLLEESNK